MNTTTTPTEYADQNIRIAKSLKARLKRITDHTGQTYSDLVDELVSVHEIQPALDRQVEQIKRYPRALPNQPVFRYRDGSTLRFGGEGEPYMMSADEQTVTLFEPVPQPADEPVAE